VQQQDFDMRLVVAVLRPSQLEAVRQALAAVHVTRLTVCDAQGYYASKGDHAGHAGDGLRGESGIVQESVMEIAVNDDFLDRTVDTIRKAMLLGDEPSTGGARDGSPRPSGRLFVLPIYDAVQLYRDVRGPEAI
jgi:nitrogen regulatory protein P-II 1